MQIIARLRSELRKHHCGDGVEEVKSELKALHRKFNRIKAKKAGSSSSSGASVSRDVLIKEQASQLKEKEDLIRYLQDDKLVLLDTVEELKADLKLMPSKQDKTYSCSTRMMVYDAMLQQLPTLTVPVL